MHWWALEKSHLRCIHDDSVNLRLCLCITAHTGPSDHRGAKSKEQVHRKHFLWSTVAIDMRTFVQLCLHCLLTTGEETVPRPSIPRFHATAQSDLLQFGYVKFDAITPTEKHVLMLHDDKSDYKCFFFVKRPHCRDCCNGDHWLVRCICCLEAAYERCTYTFQKRDAPNRFKRT